MSISSAAAASIFSLSVIVEQRLIVPAQTPSTLSLTVWDCVPPFYCALVSLVFIDVRSLWNLLLKYTVLNPN